MEIVWLNTEVDAISIIAKIKVTVIVIVFAFFLIINSFTSSC